jgi:hypothetical protein
MDRKALSKRLEGLSSIFASETPIATDLKAMAYTLDKMADDKFSEILAKDFDADKPMEEDKAAGECSNGCNCNEDGKEKAASEEGLYWNREASDIVIAGLVKEYTGASLTKEQMPDGEKKAEKPATLKEEQTPDISESLDSDIVKHSQSPVKKEAGSLKGPGKPDGTGPCKDTDECQMSGNKEAMTDEEKADFAKKMQDAKAEKAAKEDKEEAEVEAASSCKAEDKEDTEVEAASQDAVQPTKPQPGDVDENAGKTEAEATSMEEMAKNDSKEAFVSEGVELNAPMIEVSLDSKEAQDLGKLFA